jgi:16S rRNA (cytidine1402-2'-O)-methyltransferase
MVRTLAFNYTTGRYDRGDTEIMIHDHDDQQPVPASSEEGNRMNEESSVSDKEVTDREPIEVSSAESADTAASDDDDTFTDEEMTDDEDVEETLSDDDASTDAALEEESLADDEFIDETDEEAGDGADERPEIAGALYLVGTPIGNSDDITIRARRTLEFADLVVCEEYKVGARLLRNYNISKKLVEMNEHNEGEASAEIVEMVRAGKKIAVISDAGLPLLADPGTALMRRAYAAGIEPKVIPGVSSVMTALMVSGFSMERFEFVGFLPRKTEERKSAAAELASHTGTVAILETPYRLRSLLAALAEAMPDRRGAIAFNLTMSSEAVIRGTLAALEERMGTRRLKGEFVLVLDRYNAAAQRTAQAARAPRDRYEDEGHDERSAPRRTFRTPSAPRGSGDGGHSPFRRTGPSQSERPSGFRRNDNARGGDRPRSNDRREERGRGSFDRRRDDSGRGGFGGRRDESRGGGFGGRRDDSGRGGFGGRRDDSRGGGFGGRRDDAGGNRGVRRDDSRGGGFGGRRDDTRGGGGFGGRRDDARGGGFGGRRDDAGRGGFGGRRDDSGRGGTPRRFDSGRPRNTGGRDAGSQPRRRKGPDDRRRGGRDNESGIE